MKRDTVLVGALVAVALALRIPGLDQDLFGDELYAFAETHGHSLSDVVGNVRDVDESSPPLFFVLAWGAEQLGEPTIWIRAPSLLLGTLTVPLIYMLGTHVAGRRAGVLAACLLALSPFAIFYSSEARPYATLVFFATASTLTLVRALAGDGRRWWLLFCAATAALLYTHYTCIFFVGAQAGWALWRRPKQRRALLFAHGAVVVAYLPWVPHVQGRHLASFELFNEPLTPGSLATTMLRAFPGVTFAELREVPGVPSLLVLGALVLAAIAVAAGRRLRRLPPELGLIAALAVATPAGLGLYELLGGTNLVNPRNMASSLPAFLVLLGALFAWLPRRAWLPAAATAVAAVGLGTVAFLGEDYRGSGARAAAEFLDARAGPSAPVIDAFAPARASALSPGLTIYFDRPHSYYRSVANERAWAAAQRSGRVYVVFAGTAGLGCFGAPPIRVGPSDRFRLSGATDLAGSVSVGLYRNGGAERGGLVRSAAGASLQVPYVANVRVASDSATGYIERAEARHGRVTLTGWALDRGNRRAADCIVALDGDRVLAAGPPTLARPDLERTYGRGAGQAGYRLSVSSPDAEELSRGRGVSVYAISGSRATELMPLDEATFEK